MQVNQMKSKKKAKKPPSNKYAGMTRSERAKAIGRLGGLARAKNLSHEELSKISMKGGMVTYLRYGSEYYSKMSRAHWDSLTPAEQAAWLANMAEKREKYWGKQKRLAALDKINKAKRSTSSNES